jgi:hypothetical protein
MEPYTEEMFQREKKEREEREAAEEQRRQERSEMESAKKRWISDGGREADFEAVWPKLRDEARKQRVMDADRQARQSMRARGVSRI